MDEPIKSEFTKDDIIKLPQQMKDEANKIREDMLRGAIDHAIKEIQKIPDAQLLGAVSRRIYVKFKIF